MVASHIFDISNEKEFLSTTLQVFRYQYARNGVYRSFCDLLGRTPVQVTSLRELPFLPINFFKNKSVRSYKGDPEMVFRSSGTTGQSTSRHAVKDISLYETSFRKTFEQFFGPVSDYCILALLPSYLERTGSSLIHMVRDLIQKRGHPASGFYLNDLKGLASRLRELEQRGTKTLLIGVSFALLDFVERHPMHLKHTIIMETGGMKGRRREMIREELHNRLKQGFGVASIHSEYGMTELLSQAYSLGRGIYYGPPWMKISIRDTQDPLVLLPRGKTGGLNVIDLANVHSCSFIATQDLGKLHGDGGFEVLGRFDDSDLRGCNLMVL